MHSLARALALFAVLAAGCGVDDAALVDLEVSGGRDVPAFTDLRASFTLDAAESVVRGIFWDGVDPFYFRVRLPIEGDARVRVDAVAVAADSAETIVGSAQADVTLDVGAAEPARVAVRLERLR